MDNYGVTEIILLNSSIVLCKDDSGRQSPSLQGLFCEVIDKITKTFGPNDIKWFIDDKNVSFEEWYAHGAANGVDKLPIRIVDEDVMGVLHSFPVINDDV